MCKFVYIIVPSDQPLGGVGFHVFLRKILWYVPVQKVQTYKI